MNCLHYKFNHIKRSLDANRCISLDVIHLAILFVFRKDQRHLDKCPYGSKFQKKSQNPLILLHVPFLELAENFQTIPQK